MNIRQWVTFEDHDTKMRVPMGRDYSINRSIDPVTRCINDVSLSMELHPSFTLTMCFLLRRDGDLDFWNSQFSNTYNPYLHCGINGNCTERLDCSPEQRKTLLDLFLGIKKPFDIKMSPGSPILKWAGIDGDVLQNYCSNLQISVPALA